MSHPTLVAVRTFVETEVRPAASALEHADRYPEALVADVSGRAIAPTAT